MPTGMSEKANAIHWSVSTQPILSTSGPSYVVSLIILGGWCLIFPNLHLEDPTPLFFFAQC